MDRGLVLGLAAGAVALAACGTLDNTWQGEEAFTGNVNAWYLDYPESDRSHVASAVDAAAYGFAMAGDRATVVMHDMTCGVHIDSGSVFFDLDLRTGEIQDGVADSESGRQLTSLLVAEPMVTLIPIDEPQNEQQFLVRGIRQARLTDGESFVALRTTEQGTCQVRWYEQGQLDHTVDLGSDIACDGSLGFAVDRLTGDAWVATPSGVFDLVEDAPHRLPVQGDLLAWDDTSGQLYVARRGDTVVHALSQGQLAWSLELPGPIVDLDGAGLPGGLVLAHEDGLSHSVLRLDADGAELDHLSFEQPVLDVEISDAGDLMAIARYSDHAYYRIR